MEQTITNAPSHFRCYSDKSSLPSFSRECQEYFTAAVVENQVIVFVCIGSDRATGDSLGPFTGSLLAGKHEKEQNRRFALHHYTTSSFLSHKKKRHQASFYHKSYVYGTLHDPVHAVNLPHVIREIYSRWDTPYLIAIDAALGDKKNIGSINMAPGSLMPGIGVKKDLPHVGNMYITGTVNQIATQDPNYTLQTTHLSTIVDLSTFIASGIFDALSLCHVTYPCALPVPDKA